LVVVWSCSDFVAEYTKKGGTVIRDVLGNEAVDKINTMFETMCRFKHRVLIGPGNATLWRADPRFDFHCNDMVQLLRQHEILQVNPVKVMSQLEKADSFHFTLTDANRSVWTNLVVRAATLAWSFEYVRDAADHMQEYDYPAEWFTVKGQTPFQSAEADMDDARQYRDLRDEDREVESRLPLALVDGNVAGEAEEDTTPAVVEPPPEPEPTRVRDQGGHWVTLNFRTLSAVLKSRLRDSDLDCTGLSKTVGFVLRHDGRIPRARDTSVLMDDLEHELSKRRFIRSANLSRTELLECLAFAADKPRYQVQMIAGNPIAIRAIQGHSAASVDPEALRWRPIGKGEFQRLYHCSKNHALKGITELGLLPGGTRSREASKRSEVFFCGSCPHESIRPGNELFPPYKTKCNEIVVVINVDRAERENCKFFVTDANAILCQQEIPVHCIERIYDGRTLMDVWFPAGVDREDAPAEPSAPSGVAGDGAEEEVDWSPDDEGARDRSRTPNVDEPGATRSSTHASSAAAAGTAPSGATQPAVTLRARHEHRRLHCPRCNAEQDASLWVCQNCGSGMVLGPAAERVVRAIAESAAKAYNFTWRWVVKGPQTMVKNDSQRARKHYQRARGKGFASCVDRYTNDDVYRAACHREGLGQDDCRVFDLAGKPENRAPRIPVPMAKRVAKGWGRYVQTPIEPDGSSRRSHWAPMDRDDRGDSAERRRDDRWQDHEDRHDRRDHSWEGRGWTYDWHGRGWQDEDRWWGWQRR
jgi:RNA:NAD 2'-phosphotransferase (TPT1/KptA family)